MMLHTVRIGEREVGQGRPCFIIAEIGSNHDGSLDRAREFIQTSARAGADAVKFQSFSAEGLLNPQRWDEATSTWVDDPAFPVLQKLAIPDDWHTELAQVAWRSGVLFLSTPFDEAKADLLHRLGVPAFKIASGDLTHVRLLRHVARLGKPILLSTGASYMEEVQRAVQTIRDAGNQDIVLLHCVSTYPARPEHANLRAMQALHEELGLPVGFSDHTLGTATTLAAVALGASVIEKHVTTDRSRPGADHGHSLEVPEFAAMVREIRQVEAALGDGEKTPGEQEVPDRTGARRSLYAAADIPPGTIIAPDVLRVVRHRHGIGAEEIDAVVGRAAKVNIRRNEALQWEHIEAAP